jgi:apolipoprotein N-acyltransferase
MLALAFANGTARAVGYQPLIGETAARQIATASLIALLGGYVWVLHHRAPLPDRATAFAVGGSWTLLTLGFEFGFGHYVQHMPWEALLADYDLTSGRVWVLVPIATLVMPALVRALQARHGRPGSRTS